MKEVKIPLETNKDKRRDLFTEIWEPIYKCPNCNEEEIIEHDNYCCYCGAKVTWLKEDKK